MESLPRTPTPPMQALHCSVGCFHALLSVLQEPLTRFVASYRQRTDLPALSSEIEEQYVNLSKAGSKLQLQFIRDQWSGYCDLEMPESILRDAKTVLNVQNQSYYKAYSDSTPYERGVDAIRRLMLALRATEDEVRQADAITAMLNVQPSPDSPPSEAQLNKQRLEDPIEPSAEAPKAFISNDTTAISPDDVSGDRRSVGDAQSHEMLVGVGLPDTGEYVVDRPTNVFPPTSSTFKRKEAPKRDSKERRVARSCVELGDYEEAIFWIDKELVRTKRRPHTHANLYVMRSQCQYKLKQLEDAYNDARKALAIDKQAIDAYRWASAALVKLERLSEAHSICSAGLKISPTYEPLKLLEKEISRKAFYASKVGRAVANGQATSPSGSSDHGQDKTLNQQLKWKTTLQAAIRLAQKSNLTAADAAFTEALRLVGVDGAATGSKVNVLGHRARCRLSLNQFLLAIQDARAGLELNPDWLEGHRLVCKGFVGLKQWEDAMTECEIVMRGCPRDVAFLNYKSKITSEMQLPSPKSESDAGTRTVLPMWKPKPADPMITTDTNGLWRVSLL